MWSSVALAGSVDPANIGKLVLIAGIAQLRPAASLGVSRNQYGQTSESSAEEVIQAVCHFYAGSCGGVNSCVAVPGGNWHCANHAAGQFVICLWRRHHQE